MAATNFTPIQLYHSTTASAAPVAGNLANGELAINITDGKLFYKDNGGTVQVLATKGTGTIGGSNTQVQYNSSGALAGSSNFTFNGTTATINTLNLTNALGTTYGGTGLNSYTTGDIVYASASNTLSKLTIGTNGYILTSNGSIPTWTAGSSISVNTADNLSGGAAGSVPYQSGPGATTFLSIGTANRVLTSSGTAPQWVTSLTGLTGVSSSGLTNTSLTSGRVVYSTTGGAQTDSASLTFNGTTLTAGGFATGGSSTLDKLVKIGDSAFNLPAVLSATAPAKLYVSTATVTDASSAGGATNSLGTITSFGSTTVAASNTGVTYTNLATLYIAGAPTAGTNVTITNPYALYVAAGDAYFGGTVTAGTVNLTTLDLTNLEVTNIKAKDGTASITLADSTGVASFTANPVLSGGTANGVAYLNGSKVLTSGSALTYNGTNLGLSYTADARGGVVLTTTNNTGVNEQGGFQVTNGNGTGVFAGVNGASFTTGGIGSANNAVLYSIGNTDLVFGRNTTEVMRLASTGVTITNSTVRLSNGYDIGWGAASTYLAGNSSSNVIQFVTNSAEIGRFTSAGMGVGTTDTSNGRINVVAGTGATGNSLFLTNVDGTYNPYVQFQHNGINGVTLLSSSSYGGTASNFTISIAGTPTATFNGNGNTGLQCVPSAWSGNTVLELFNSASAIRGDVYQGAVGGNNVTGLSHNAYFDGTNWKTIYTAATYYASRYEQTSGEHAFYIAGLTNGTISFTKAVTIDNSSRLLLGTTTALGKLAVGLTPTTNSITELADFPTSSRVILGDVAGVSTTNSQVFFGAGFSSGGNGINSGIGFLREASGNWGTSLLFYTHPTSTANEDQLVEVGRFTSGGLFGVGISSPAQLLDVRSANVNGATGATIRVGSQTNGGAGDEFANLEFYWGDPDSAGVKAKIYTKNVGNVGPGGGGAADLLFATTPAFGSVTEGMRLTSNNYLLVNTTDSQPLGSSFFNGRIVTTNSGNVNGIYSVTTDSTTSYCYVAANNGTSSQALMSFHNYNGSTNPTVGSISHNGTTTTYATSSDYRLKDVTGPITDSGAYIDSLKPVEGTWKSNGSVFVGLLAHEAQEVSRTRVATGEKDGKQMQGMDYGNSEFIANIIAELQSLRKRVAQLEQGV